MRQIKSKRKRTHRTKSTKRSLDKAAINLQKQNLNLSTCMKLRKHT